MKVAMVEEPGVLTIREIPIPSVGDYDVLCKLLYGATCTGTDGHIIAGSGPFNIQYPTILGHESIGIVIEMGAKVRNYRIGNLVTRVGVPAPKNGEYRVHWGGFAEYGIARDYYAMREDGMPREEWYSYRVNHVLPEGFDPASSTMIITWRETLSYIKRIGIREGYDILIIGSGGNGLSFIAHAVNSNARHVVMIGNKDREKIARELGVTDYYDYRVHNSTVCIKDKYSQRFDIIIDSLGRTCGLDSVIDQLKNKGTAAIYGVDDGNECVIHPKKVRGSFIYYNNGYDEEESHHDVIEYIRKNKLKADVWMDLKKPFLLDNIQEAFQAVYSRKSVKALIKLDIS